MNFTFNNISIPLSKAWFKAIGLPVRNIFCSILFLSLFFSFQLSAQHINNGKISSGNPVQRVLATLTVSSSPNPSCLNSNVVFTATINPNTSTGTIEFYDGATPIGSNTISGGTATLNLSTLSPGTHSITAKYLGDGSISPAISHVVRSALVGGSHNTLAVTACVGYNPPQLDVNVPNTSGGLSPYNYQWQINNVNTGTASTSISYDPPALLTAGTYNYHAVITDVCGAVVTTIDKTITIVDDPIVTISGGGGVCINNSITLTANITGGTGIMNYQWQSGTSSSGPWTDISGATLSNYSPPTTSTGNFFYRVTLSPNVASCNNSSSTVTVTVNPTPAITNQTPAAICSGATVNLSAATFTGSNTIPAGTTYTWSTPVAAGITGLASGTDQSSFTTGALTNTTNAAINVTYSVTPKSGTCTGSPFTVTVTVNPTPAITNQTPAAICSGATVNLSAATFTGSNTIPAGTTYTWSTPVAAGITGLASGTDQFLKQDQLFRQVQHIPGQLR